VRAGCGLGGRPGWPGQDGTSRPHRNGRGDPLGPQPAPVIAARTAAAEGAWYSQKQVSSSGTRIAPRKRTGAPSWLACPARATSAAPPGGVGFGQELGHASHGKDAAAGANLGNLATLTAGPGLLGGVTQPPGQLGAGADAELGVGPEELYLTVPVLRYNWAAISLLDRPVLPVVRYTHRSR
jgi:hypothetical protein